MDQTQPSDSSVRLHVFHSNNQDPTHDADEPCAPSNPLPPKTLDNCEVQTNATNGASCHSSTTPNHHRRELRADPWRFVIAPIFCILSISNAMQWIAFSPIVDEVRDFFGMSAQAVNFLATTYVISYVAIVFLSCKLYEVTGIKLGVLIAALANTLGAALKLVALYVWPHAALLYVAQVFNSLTEVLTIATPPLISNRWFPEGERIVANTILSSALNFGCGIGVLIPTFFVGPTKDERHNFGNLFGFHFALCGSVLLAVIFLFPKKPRTSASYMAAHQQGREEQRLKVVAALLGRGKQKNEEAANVAQELERPTRRDSSVTSGEEILEFDTEDDDGPEVEPVNVFSVLMDCFREARQNLSFILLAVGSAAELGLIWAVATVLPQMLQPYGVSEATAGWIGFCNLVLGTVVCPFFMPLVEKYGRRYKLVLCSLATVLLLNMILLTLLLHFGPSRSDASDSEEDHRSYYITIAFICWGGISGLCQNFMMPLMFEYVVELTFPMAESTSAPVLTWSACLSNFLLALIFGEVLSNNPTEERALRVFIGATVVTAIGALALFLTKPSYKRRDYENQQREKEALNTTQATKSLPEPEKITLPDETAQTRV